MLFVVPLALRAALAAVSRIAARSGLSLGRFSVGNVLGGRLAASFGRASARQAVRKTSVSALNKLRLKIVTRRFTPPESVNRTLKILNNAGVNRETVRKMAILYLDFLHERYEKYSMGGGDWKQLAKSTKRKKKRKGSDPNLILRDTDTLFNLLDPSTPGIESETLKFSDKGMKVGYLGFTSHPNGRTTTTQLAQFHQAGGGNLPQRKIIVRPPRSVVAKMAIVVLSDTTKHMRKGGFDIPTGLPDFDAN